MSVIRSDIDPEAVLRALSDLEDVYPDFSGWYRKKVVPGLADGSRTIFASMEDGRIAGVAIAKRSGIEKKLSTLWTAPDAGRNASELGEMAFEWLGTRRPHFSIPDDLMPLYRPLLARWDMAGAEVAHGLYRDGVAEHIFNGKIDKDFA